MLKAPKFWFESKLHHRICAWALSPLSWTYGSLAALKVKYSKPKKVDLPVICVGNLVAGGAGKTPFVLWLAHKLASDGIRPHVILRGYGGQEKTNRRVKASDTVVEVGDEALLYAQEFSTWVGGNRVVSAQMALAEKADLVLMDDGFQNPSLKKDLSILVVDRHTGFGNGWVMPAGPLREAAHEALKRVECLVLMGNWDTPMPQDVEALLEKHQFAGLLVEAHVQVNEPDQAWLKGRNVLAFSGIGRPQKFFDSLRQVGANVVEAHSFADHHNFSRAEFSALLDRANTWATNQAKSGGVKLELVTTTKDFMRLSPDQRLKCRPIGVHVTVKNESDFINLLQKFRIDSSI